MTKKEVHPQEQIAQLSEALKKLDALKPPEWSHYVKTGTHREHPPEQPDWWYTRAASVLRRIYLDGPVGLARLRTFYGGRKNRGSSPERFRKGGGKIIRTILQQLESVMLVEKAERSGRRITSKGASMVDHAAVKPEPKPKAKPEIKPEVKAKPEIKAEEKPEVKAKPEIKAEEKPEVKAKPEVKPEEKPEVKAKPEIKTEEKPTEKPEGE